MPIVKQKLFNDLQDTFQTILHSSQSEHEIKVKHLSNTRSPFQSFQQGEHNASYLTTPLEDGNSNKIGQTEPNQTNVDSTAQLTTLLSQIESEVDKTLPKRDARFVANNAIIYKIGLSTVHINGTSKKIELLTPLMSESQKSLSEWRKKLLQQLRTLRSFQIQNTYLDHEMENVAFDRYYERKAEVNRISEKLEETTKGMNSSRKQFENNVARATHGREKLFNYINRMLSTTTDVCDILVTHQNLKQHLCATLKLKNQLWEKNERIKRCIRVMCLLA